jgi:adenylyltransferase/sulfurtransferase
MATTISGISRGAGITDDRSSDLAPEEVLRYSRHLLLDEVGIEGQRRIKNARVLMIGAGGLGSPTALYLAAAGVGTLGLVEDDIVDATNLQRQLLHGTKDVGRPKSESARDRLHDVNPHVHVEQFNTRFTADNALEILRDFDIIVDGTDNFATRYLTNDPAVLLGKPNVYGSIFRFEGQASVFGVENGPCYRCLFREPPPAGLVPSCSEAGVLGVLPGLIGTIQGIETLKIILGLGEPLVGRLLLVETLAMTFRTIGVRKDPTCPACGADTAHGGRSIRSLQDRVADYAETACEVDFGDAPAKRVREITPRELAARIAGRSNGGGDFDLIDVRQPTEWNISRIEGARLIPLGTLQDAIGELDRSREVVLYCKGGVRSDTAAEQLLDAGFQNVWSLAGGILRWGEEIDPTLPRY